jgi:hypothetical protein
LASAVAVTPGHKKRIRFKGTVLISLQHILNRPANPGDNPDSTLTQNRLCYRGNRSANQNTGPVRLQYIGFCVWCLSRHFDMTPRAFRPHDEDLCGGIEQR